jgi:glucosamine--fructose-6-phosphate aminotransferase (isomerizing)
MLEDIRNQPDSLAQVVRYQCGEGSLDLIAAAGSICESKRVVLTGMGSSLFACYPLHFYLLAHGIHSVVVDAGELLHYGGLLCRDAVLVMVSRSGESIEIERLLDTVDCRTVVGVTNVVDSTLWMRSHRRILINGMADELVAIQTYTATVLSMLALGATVAGELEQRTAELEQAPIAMREAVVRYEAESEGWREFFDGVPAVYLLGRGPSVASVLEGALMFHEASKFPAVAMQAGAFRHGPVEVVDEKYRALIFATEDRTRDMALSLARDLEAYGGRVKVIGARDWPLPDLPEWLAPVIESVPVQLASYRLALWRGIQPGKFRHATLVTRVE